MSVRSKVPVVARTLLGLAFLVFGANFFLNFLPEPAPPPEAGAFLGALVTGKILTIAKVIEVVAGLLLISNLFVPLALAVLAPVEIGILAFHAVFAPAGLPLPAILVALTVYLAWAYRAAFAPMLRAHVQPLAPEPVVAHDPATV